MCLAVQRRRVGVRHLIIQIQEIRCLLVGIVELNCRLQVLLLIVHTGPGHQHELIAKSVEYVCKFCGMKLQNTMARTYCVRSASKTHVLINAKSSYTCRYCGQTAKSSSFATAYCPKGPGHQHELID